MGVSSIEWTDQTWNPVVGCDKVSPGCAHCYAETMAARLQAMALADIDAGREPGRKRHYVNAIDDKGRWSGKLIPVPESLADPLSWRKPRRVFVNSMSDLFHESVPDEFIDRVFATISLTPQHTYQVLTKRAERMAQYCTSVGKSMRIMSAARTFARGRGSKLMNDAAVQCWPLPNVWLGVSCEDQKRADERIPWLLKTPAAVRFLSCEPLLGRIDLGLRNWSHIDRDDCRLDWVIVGGESGPHARPCRETWIRDLVRECSDAEVPVFVKQLGSNPETGFGVNRKLNLKDKKGGDPDEWPEDLRVREFPRTEAANA